MTDESVGEGPTGEVAGRVVACAVEGMADHSPGGRETAQQLLGTDDLAPAEGIWYSLAVVADAMAGLRAVAGPETVRDLGRRVGRRALRRGDVGPVPARLANIDDVYSRDHRGDVGGYAFRRIGERDGRVECTTPYPCAFDRGFVDGVAATQGEELVCFTEVGACHDDGTDRCTYEIQW